MKRFVYALAFAVCAWPGTLSGQSAPVERSSLRAQLMPSGAAVALIAPAPAATNETPGAQPNQPALVAPGEGIGYMIAGAALFVAGLLIEGDAGTFVAVAGAGIGAYGLYLHFR
ncbi:MAG: hypothetical protein ACT443_04960 [Gemmatimonadota bacterium]